jgi:hypothetical protein
MVTEMMVVMMGTVRMVSVVEVAVVKAVIGRCDEQSGDGSDVNCGDDGNGNCK